MIQSEKQKHRVDEEVVKELVSMKFPFIWNVAIYFNFYILIIFTALLFFPLNND